MLAVGTAQNATSSDAGRFAAKVANESISEEESPQWALAFVGGRHDPDKILDGLRTELGDIPILGGSAVGTITHQSLSYTGYECTVAVFTDPIPKPRILTIDSLESGDQEAGRQLGHTLREHAEDGSTVLVFYDSIKSSPPPVLHVGSLLLDGIYEGLDGKELDLIGAGLLGDHQFTSSFIFDGQRSVTHAAVAIILPSILQSQTKIMHGCKPISPFMEITRIEGPTIYELDGRPALDVLIGMSDEDDPIGSLSLSFTLGEKHGDPFAPYRESAYVNRLIMGADLENRSITLFEADFHPGTKVQVMMRDNEMMVDSVRRLGEEFVGELGTKRLILGLYIDCAGRCVAFSGAETEEASVLQQLFSDICPLLGFYSGVEIAPLLGRSRPLDWTGVLTALTLRDDM